MTSFLVNVMDDGDNPTEEVLYIKRIFEDSLRDNGSYEQIRNHLDKELEIEKKNTFGSIAKNLSLGRKQCLHLLDPSWPPLQLDSNSLSISSKG